VQALLSCPDCGVPAEITERFRPPGTDGPADQCGGALRRRGSLAAEFREKDRDRASRWRTSRRRACRPSDEHYAGPACRGAVAGSYVRAEAPGGGPPVR
jgi:hypothetical protein